MLFPDKMVIRSNSGSKRVSVNYGDLSEDMLKLASQSANKSNKPSPSLKTKETNPANHDNISPGNTTTDLTTNLENGAPSGSSGKNYNDEALAALSGAPLEDNTPPLTHENLLLAGFTNNSINNMLNTTNIKARRQTHIPNISNNTGTRNMDKRHSINYTGSRNRPSNLPLNKSNRFSAFDGSDTNNVRLVKQMLSPIETSGSESFSPHAASPTGLGLDTVVSKKEKDFDSLRVPKSANSPSFKEKEINPFGSFENHSPNLKSNFNRAGPRHFRSQSVNFHSRNKSLSVKPTYSPVIASPAVNLNANASFEDIKDEYPHCVPVHTKSKRSLLSLMKVFPETSKGIKFIDGANNISPNGQNSNENSKSATNATADGPQFYSQKIISLFGLKNLLMILFVLNNFGLLIEYYNNYFTLSSIYSTIFLFKYNTDIQFFIICLALTPLYYLYTYIIEKILYLLTVKKFNFIVRSKYSESFDGTGPENSNKYLGVPTGGFGKESLNFKLTNDLLPANYLLPMFAMFYFTNVSLIFAVNNIIIVKFIYNPILGTVLELHTIVSILKVISFALANRNLRELYFKSINSSKYLRYLKQKRRLINSDGTFNVIKNKDLKKTVEDELLVRMTGSELSETINTLKLRKNSDGSNNEEKENDEDFEEEKEIDFVDQNLQPKFYEGNFYPSNINVSDVMYFSVVPTVVYQPVYPTSKQIRWKYCVDKVLEIVVLMSVIFYLSSQYAIPILKDSILNTFNLSHGFQAPDIASSVGPASTSAGIHSSSSSYTLSSSTSTTSGQVKLIEFLIKLANVSILIWLITYYLVFHDYLNLIAEVTKFDDREFYEQWWNSGSVSSYWKTWNMVFYNFFERHFYKPLIISRERHSISSNAGDGNTSNQLSSSGNKVNALIFLIMAVMQEIVVGVPTGNIMGISFICILVQSPLSILTNPLEKLQGENSTIGNAIFWISFIIGQPLCILLYYFTWNIKYGELSSY